MVAAAEQKEVLDGGRAALCPVVDMMGVEEAPILTSGEAAATIARAERAPDRRRDRARLAAVPDEGGVAGEPSRRFRGERASVFELAAALAVVRERGFVGVDDDLVALPARTRL